MKKINYDPLRTPSIHLSELSRKQKTFAALCVLACITLMFSFDNPSVLGRILAMVSTYILIFSTLSIVIWLINRRGSQEKLWLNFAQSNGWRVQANTPGDIPPALVGIAETEIISPTVVITDLVLPARLLYYKYWGTLKEYRHDNSCIILRLELPRVFPHVVFDSQYNQDGVRRFIGKLQNVELEGDFNNSFKVYIEENMQIDAMSVVAPNAMMNLLDHNKNIDVEIYKNTLYFIATSPNINESMMKILLEATQPFIKDLIHKSQSIKNSELLSDFSSDSQAISAIPLSLTHESKKFLVIILLATGLLFLLFYLFMRSSM